MTQIIAHRGASLAERENTVAAFRKAAALGADAIEFDVRSTADEALVIYHDATLSDGTAIAEVAADRLPSWIPTFAEALDACGEVPVNVEIKHEPECSDEARHDAHVERVLEGLGAWDRAVGESGQDLLISSFRFDTVRAVVERFPAARTGLLVEEPPGEYLGRTLEAGIDSIGPDECWVDQATVVAAHDLGLAINVWTVDDPHRLDTLLEWHVDAVFTNAVALALQRRERRG